MCLMYKETSQGLSGQAVSEVKALCKHTDSISSQHIHYSGKSLCCCLLPVVSVQQGENGPEGHSEGRGQPGITKNVDLYEHRLNCV